jgi:subtilisin family serine protease
MNMSLGGSKSTALNSAVAALPRSGVTAIVAAGNDNVSEDAFPSALKLICPSSRRPQLLARISSISYNCRRNRLR